MLMLNFSGDMCVTLKELPPAVTEVRRDLLLASVKQEQQIYQFLF